MKKLFQLTSIIIILLSFNLTAQYSIYEPLRADEIEFSFLDFGTMWTFDDIPEGYFQETYGFVPTEEWLNKVRFSALQFGGGCSAAFVSGDGLIMTNHHCGRGALSSVQEEGENILRDGFYAETLEDERKMPNHYVDQLHLIEDVTERVQNAMTKGETDQEIVDNRDLEIASIVAEYAEETGLTCRVVTLYNGGKYSLYGYKRYTDIRLVMAPDFQIAATGWDWDNFTYPRYELDFAFYRAYDENGDPVKSENHFTWSDKGAREGEPIFVVGRPGNTDRLFSMAQLEYFRDYTYPLTLTLYNELYGVYFELFQNHPERESELLNRVLGYGNGRKSYAGRLLGLKDEYLMAKKYDFENKLKEKVNNDSELKDKYGSIWESIDKIIDDLETDVKKSYAYSNRRWSQIVWMNAATSLIEYAREMKKDEDERSPEYADSVLAETISTFMPETFDEEFQHLMLKAHANFVTKSLGRENEVVKKSYNGLMDNEALEYVLSKTKIKAKEDVIKFAKLSPDEILSSDDPFIQWILNTRDDLSLILERRREANSTLSVLNQQLGKLIFDTFGNNIPPDATSTLRISDGIIAGYEYNGTIAPGKVTYYGLWDRYNSFDKSTYPWGLHPRWKTPPTELDLSIPVGIATTNDIVGGNSGSSIINKDLEVIGLVHDGNLESLAGHFAFLPENNRTVATDSWGMMEALKYIYKTDRLVYELQNSKLPEKE
jgi:hypothetical protein